MISRQAILKTKGDSGKIGLKCLPFSKRAKKTHTWKIQEWTWTWPLTRLQIVCPLIPRMLFRSLPFKDHPKIMTFKLQSQNPLNLSKHKNATSMFCTKLNTSHVCNRDTKQEPSGMIHENKVTKRSRTSSNPGQWQPSFQSAMISCHSFSKKKHNILLMVNLMFVWIHWTSSLMASETSVFYRPKIMTRLNQPRNT